jgi:uncharacterized protein (PEP-CTERM system associated)
MTDASDSFRGLAPVGAQQAVATGPNASSPATFERHRAEAGFIYSAVRTTATFTGYWTDDSYQQNSAFDVARWNTQFTVSRRMRPSLTAIVGATVSRSNYKNVSLVDRGRNYSLAVEWRASGDLFLRTRLERDERDASGALNDYEENRLTLTLRYVLTKN